MGEEWSRASWRNKDRIQMPSYGDEANLKYVEKTLNSCPPLVFALQPTSTPSVFCPILCCSRK